MRKFKEIFEDGEASSTIQDADIAKKPALVGSGSSGTEIQKKPGINWTKGTKRIEKMELYLK